MFKQLPLSFAPREVFNFASFVGGDNHLAITMLKQLASDQGEKQLYLWSGRGQGKSHLLQAACHHASRQNASVCYLPVSEIIVESVDIFEDMERLDLICLDDIHHFAGDRGWEVALFDLVNRVRASGARLLMSANQPPENLAVKLPDLGSRLSWGPVFQLQALSDAEKREALQLRARLCGLDLTENVADYLLRHYPRDLFGLFERLEKLDTAAMAMQRRLTIPFIKTVLDQSA